MTPPASSSCGVGTRGKLALAEQAEELEASRGAAAGAREHDLANAFVLRQRPAHGVLATQAVGAFDMEGTTVGADGDGEVAVQSHIAGIEVPHLIERGHGAIPDREADQEDTRCGHARGQGKLPAAAAALAS